MPLLSHLARADSNAAMNSFAVVTIRLTRRNTKTRPIATSSTPEPNIFPPATRFLLSPTTGDPADRTIAHRLAGCDRNRRHEPDQITPVCGHAVTRQSQALPAANSLDTWFISSQAVGHIRVLSS